MIDGAGAVFTVGDAYNVTIERPADRNDLRSGEKIMGGLKSFIEVIAHTWNVFPWENGS